MENFKIKQLKERLKKHWDFFDNKNYYEETEILNWVADAVVLLTEIGVRDVIIKAFIETFELVEVKGTDDEYAITRGPNKVRKLGTFVSKREFYEPWGKYENSESGKITILKIAYRSADAILDKGIGEEKIVPKCLINELEINGKYNNIISSLELIQSTYEDRDPDGLIKNTLTLLDSILDLEESLKIERVISKKLEKLRNNSVVREEFGVNEEFINALNNSRIIRNLKSVHKNKSTEYNIKFYNIPFLVSTTFAYLVITFLEITISTGELIKNN